MQDKREILNIKNKVYEEKMIKKFVKVKIVQTANQKNCAIIEAYCPLCNDYYVDYRLHTPNAEALEKIKLLVVHYQRCPIFHL